MNEEAIDGYQGGKADRAVPKQKKSKHLFGGMGRDSSSIVRLVVSLQSGSGRERCGATEEKVYYCLREEASPATPT